ncbi:hypothetical protein [Heyndrickxia camelliae]|uniref:Uncharacterized protein n=1 Tax=Heyndrickxia camelliae TaxID=1707093 RepID=A0A2N3LCQ8_9BACI|nr:hypothetical protein [Heyndrickxia camelliae]PKR82442.1 hypothetical protein CWO92_24370 [Heyndrickxia camelliae]
MFSNNKIEVISFKDFMSRPAHPIERNTPLQTSIYSFFPPITLKALFPLHDPTFSLFILACGTVIVFAITEKIFAVNGLNGIASSISSFLKFAFPIGSFGIIFWFLFHI